MCGGPSSAQTENQQAQADFYKKQIAAYDTAYKNYTDLTATLKAQFQPILDAGPGQFGYTPGETTALRTQSTEGTAQAYAAAQRALQQRLATQGGGTSNINLTGGPSQQIQGELASTAAQESARENLDITTSGYAQGRANWQNAVTGFQNLAAGWNPNAFAGTTISAGSSAASEANTIAAQKNQMWGSVLGALGGIAGNMAGGWATGGFKLPGGGGGGGGINPGTMGVTGPYATTI